MRADLLVFSGRLGSFWYLDQDEGKRLYELLRVLPGTLMSVPDKGGVDYRGIRVAMLYDTLTIHRGVAEAVSASHSEVRRFIDYSRDMEMWIFQTARGRIPDEIYNRILLSEFST